MEFTFENNTSLDSLDAVPENFQVLYKEVDGKHVLDKDNPAVSTFVGYHSGSEKALKASRAETTAAKKQRVDISTLSEFGDTPDAIKVSFEAKVEELKEAARKAGGEKLATQVEKIKEDLAKNHTKEMEAKEKRIEALTGQLYGLMVTNELNTSISEAKGNPKLLVPMLQQSIKVKEEDGKFVVSVVDKAGDVRYSGATGAPMSVKELVMELKDNKEYGAAFDSDTPGGGGRPPGGGPQNRRPTGKDMTSTQKIAAGLRKGQHTAAGAGNV